MRAYFILVALLAITMVTGATCQSNAQLKDASQIFGGFQAYVNNRMEFVTVEGTSMAPAFKQGDTLIAIPFSMNSLKVGDIVVWETQGQLIAHRIYEISQEHIWTKGDNMPAPDTVPVSSQNYRWLVLGVLFTSSESWKEEKA